jgi:hypothetical protein
VSVLSGFSAAQFREAQDEKMTLAHHAAFDGKIHMLQAMATLPYFKEVVNDDSNEVTTPTLILFISSHFSFQSF